MLAYGLIAGLGLGDMDKMPPGLICDLFVYRQMYDDVEHGVKRRHEPRCAD